MTEQEFMDKLKDGCYDNNPQTQADLRLPVVQHHMSFYTNSMAIVNGVVVSSRMVSIIYDNRDFSLLNQAFESIRLQFVKE